MNGRMIQPKKQKQKHKKKMPKKSEMPELTTKKKAKLVRRQPSMWDDLRHDFTEPGVYKTGFVDGPQAAQAAKRLRDMWHIPVKSWVDPIEGPCIGILTEEEETKEESGE